LPCKQALRISLRVVSPPRFVFGGNSGTHTKETVKAAPFQEVPLPGAPGPVDCVAFGPQWILAVRQVRRLWGGEGMLEGSWHRGQRSVGLECRLRADDEVASVGTVIRIFS
jgi:hypothetical protein